MNWTKTTRKLMGRKPSHNWATGLMYAALTGAAVWGVTAIVRRIGKRTEEPTGDEVM